MTKEWKPGWGAHHQRVIDARRREQRNDAKTRTAFFVMSLALNIALAVQLIKARNAMRAAPAPVASSDPVLIKAR